MLTVDDAVYAIVTGDHPEGAVNDPGFEITVIDLLQAGQLAATRAQDGTICLQLTDEGHNALAVLSRIGDPDAD